MSVTNWREALRDEAETHWRLVSSTLKGFDDATTLQSNLATVFNPFFFKHVPTSPTPGEDEVRLDYEIALRRDHQYPRRKRSLVSHKERKRRKDVNTG